MWYRAGTVSVTNGSATVTGAGTDFVSNASVGEAFLGPDGRAYEITQVVSATQIVLGMPYQGAGAGGQGYAVLPTQSFARDLARGAAELLNTFASVRDGVGQGMFPDGTLAAPGIRFANDQDTGLQPQGANTIGVVLGGATRARFEPDGTLRIGSTANGGSGGIALPSPFGWLDIRPDGENSGVGTRLTYTYAGGSQGSLIIGRAAGEVARFDPLGNLLLGVTSSVGYGGAHRIARGVGEGGVIAGVDGAFFAQTALFYSVQQNNFSTAACAAALGRNSQTGRSINAGGTINAGGADYAEYILKAAGCGLIAKGDVCGVDRDGKLTKTWAEAVSFVIKSTDPSLVGGDTWDADVGPKPDEPGAEPAEPAPPVPPADDADEAAIAAWRDAMAAYPAQVASYQTARAEWQKATDAYAKALPVWEAAHEKARQCVDRIAFCGQVPANVSGDFNVGDYIIAAASGAGIKAVAVKEDDMTLPQYMHRIGKVWAIRDGRAWIDVQHG